MARNKTQIGEKYHAPFPTALRGLIDETGETQENIARAVGKTRQTVSQYVNGISEPSYETLVKIAQFFNVSTDYLLGIVKEKTPNTDVRAICSFTGLSEENVIYLNNPHSIFGEKKTDPFTLTDVHILANDLIGFCSKKMLDLDLMQMMLMLSAKKEQNTQYTASTAVSYGEAEAIINQIGMATIPALDGAKFYAREIGDAITRCFVQKYIDSSSDNK